MSKLGNLVAVEMLEEVMEQIKALKIEQSYGETAVVDEWDYKEEVGEIFLNLMYEYFGEEAVHVDDEECELEEEC